MPSLNEMRKYLKNRKPIPVRNNMAVDSSSWLRRQSMNSIAESPVFTPTPVTTPKSNNNVTRFAFEPTRARPMKKTRKANRKATRKSTRKATRKHRR